MIKRKKTKKILLMGGEGFIGRNIARHLSGEFLCASIGVVRSPFIERIDKFVLNNPYQQQVKEKYDIYVHLIDNAVADDKFIEQEKAFIKNVNFPIDSQLILFSSAVVYANPESPYGKRKMELEKIYTEYCDERGITLAILRLFNTFGEYQFPFRQGSLVANLIYNHLVGQSTEINDMSAKRDYMYSADVALFVYKAITDRFDGVTDIATGSQISVRELISTISADITKQPLNIVDLGKKENLSCPAGRNELSFAKSLTPLPIGLKKTYDFMRNNQVLIESLIKKP